MLTGGCICEWGFGEVFGRVWRGCPGWVPQCSPLGVLGRGMFYQRMFVRYVFLWGVGDICGVPGGFGDVEGVYLMSVSCPLQVPFSPSLQCSLVLVCLGVCLCSRF